MNITAEQSTAHVGVTILKLQGDLDGSNYLDLIAAAKTAQQNGAKRLLVDLSGVPYMSSAGLVALHSAVLLLQGKQPPDPEAGWSALKSVALNASGTAQQLVKLLNPQPRVTRTLEMSGMNVFIETYTDEAAALATF
ncbi:MAG TPA: STAS domain-containing protein [Anaerolineae bacterium]|nr:STAS domain-containing protein [Anaerolineae bacterium]